MTGRWKERRTEWQLRNHESCSFHRPLEISRGCLLAVPPRLTTRDSHISTAPAAAIITFSAVSAEKKQPPPGPIVSTMSPVQTVSYVPGRSFWRRAKGGRDSGCEGLFCLRKTGMAQIHCRDLESRACATGENSPPRQVVGTDAGRGARVARMRDGRGFRARPAPQFRVFSETP
jgi:hypothetical protein